MTRRARVKNVACRAPCVPICSQRPSCVTRRVGYSRETPTQLISEYGGLHTRMVRRRNDSSPKADERRQNPGPVYDEGTAGGKYIRHQAFVEPLANSNHIPARPQNLLRAPFVSPTCLPHPLHPLKPELVRLSRAPLALFSEEKRVSTVGSYLYTSSDVIGLLLTIKSHA